MSFGARASSYATAVAPTWEPTDLPSLAVWLDPADTATITHSSGAVSQINDKSGNARHHTQGTGSVQPATGTRSRNGRNVLDVAGGDRLAYTWAATSQPITVAGLVDLDTVGGAALAFYARGTVNSWLAGADAAPSWRAYGGASLTGGTPTTGPHAVVYVFNGVSSLIRVDGVQVASGSASTGGFTAAAHGWGASGTGAAPMDGGLGDLVICTAAIAGADLTNLEAYLADKWGL